MASAVDRTFVINFTVVPSKLKYSDISDFITKKLGFELVQLKHLQIINGRVFIGTDSPQKAQEVVQEHNMKYQLEHEGKFYSIPISMEDGSVEVRVQDLRPKITNRQLAQRMREFGEIIGVREEVWKDNWPGVPNGVRLLRMKLSKPIPSYVSVETEMSHVTYKGQTPTCKHCNRMVHYTKTCSEYAKSLKPSVNDRMVSGLSMADVLKGSRNENATPQSKPKETTTQQTVSGLGRSQKNLPLHRSNISLADETTTIAASEPMTIETLADQRNADSREDSSEAAGIESSSANHGLSPPFFGISDAEMITVKNVQKQTANVKRLGSPLPVDRRNIDKRPTRSETRTDTRSENRSISRTRNN